MIKNAFFCLVAMSFLAGCVTNTAPAPDIDQEKELVLQFSRCDAGYQADELIFENADDVKLCYQGVEKVSREGVSIVNYFEANGCPAEFEHVDDLDMFVGKVGSKSRKAFRACVTTSEKVTAEQGTVPNRVKFYKGNCPKGYSRAARTDSLSLCLKNSV